MFLATGMRALMGYHLPKVGEKVLASGRRFESGLACADEFFQARPSGSVVQLSKKVEERKQAALNLLLMPERKKQFSQMAYGPVTRQNLSWMYRQISPDKQWEGLELIRKGGDVEGPSVINPKMLGQSSRKDGQAVERLQSLIEKRNGRGQLLQMTGNDLRLIWSQFVQHKAYDEMVELFNCCYTDALTSSSHLTQLAFAHLNSSYMHPSWSRYLAEKVLEKEDLPQARYVLGMSLSASARVARQMFKENNSQKCELSTIDLFKKCFPAENFLHSHALVGETYDKATTELEKAFNQQPNMLYGFELVFTLIEKGNLEGASRQLLEFVESGKTSWLEISIKLGEFEQSLIQQNLPEELDKFYWVRNDIREKQERQLSGSRIID